MKPNKFAVYIFKVHPHFLLYSPNFGKFFNNYLLKHDCLKIAKKKTEQTIDSDSFFQILLT